MEKHVLNMWEAWVPTPVPKQKNKCNINDRKELMILNFLCPIPWHPEQSLRKLRLRKAGRQATF